MFWQAAWIGIAIAAPVGPIGLLCISRTLRGGPRLGWPPAWRGERRWFVRALWRMGKRFAMQLAGALAGRWGGRLPAAGLAWHRHLRRPAAEGRMTRTASGKAYLSALLLTLGNPMTILSFAAVAAVCPRFAP
ncbi:hypothetical protein BI343_14805 [Chromobacterium amazonense]|uniref:hypothetical protein n=1 Tax=Chromobacterium amazonense TaxID=1382803 RepID=UPI0008DB06E0|nr:hypothetical protein [Chromobacterium amazonense]OHX16565.1 hypothetical protein BI343_14805 [Chromobacterium amazonense]